MKPDELGFPAKFDEWRKGQFEAILESCLKLNNNYGQLIEAVTGSGKSAIGYGIHALSQGQKTVYLVGTKSLQKQIENDFGKRIAILKGRSNYPCLLHPDATANDCTHDSASGKYCPNVKECPYLVAKKIALAAPICCLNYSMFLTEANNVGGFSRPNQLIICDEVDIVESELMNFIQVGFSENELERMNRYDVPDAPSRKTVVDSWIEWAKNAMTLLKNELRDDIDADTPIRIIKEQQWIERKVSKLSFFIEEVGPFCKEADKELAKGKTKWVMVHDTDKKGFTFKPVWVNAYAKQFLWIHAKNMVGMSATILEPRILASSIGLDSYSSLKIESTFPPKNRQIYYNPVADVIYKNKDYAYPQLAMAVENIMGAYPNDKGLIHCSSYALSYYLQHHVKKTSRFVTHSQKDREQILEMFRSSSSPFVMISPSMERGVDLPGEQCRFIIVCKMMYPDSKDPQIAARLYGSKGGRQWYIYTTVASLIQSTGRGVRSEQDVCDIYILDRQFERILKENKYLFPKWWLDSLIFPSKI